MGLSSRPPGKERHLREVSSDSHPVTLQNEYYNIKCKDMPSNMIYINSHSMRTYWLVSHRLNVSIDGLQFKFEVQCRVLCLFF